VFRRGVSTKQAAGQRSAGDPSTGVTTEERGIGLSLVHLVCTRRGGEVTASSVGGSTFTARLPAEPALAGS
jgi:two-component system CitB family sensor kinase